MSRGPGRWQRAILDAVERGPVALTRPDLTPAEQSAIRRAANVLESAGRIKLTAERVAGGPARLVAYPPDADVRVETVHGLDGKHYRRPAGPPLDVAELLPDCSPEDVAELLRMADASEPEFERALRLAKLEGDLSRDNILRRLRRP